MRNPDDLARFRDEQGRKWVLVYSDSHGAALQMWLVLPDGQRDGPRAWDDVSADHQLTRLYPPPEAL